MHKSGGGRIGIQAAAELPVGELPERFTEICDNIVEPKAHLVFLNDADRDEHLFPKAWNLKGGD